MIAFVYGTYPQTPSSILCYSGVMDYEIGKSKTSFDGGRMLHWGFVYQRQMSHLITDRAVVIHETGVSQHHPQPVSSVIREESKMAAKVSGGCVPLRRLRNGWRHQSSHHVCHTLDHSRETLLLFMPTDILRDVTKFNSSGDGGNLHRVDFY